MDARCEMDRTRCWPNLPIGSTERTANPLQGSPAGKNTGRSQPEGDVPGVCPHQGTAACAAYVEHLRECSYSLAEHTTQHFCQDRFLACARYRAMKAGNDRAGLGRLAPWDSWQA